MLIERSKIDKNYIVIEDSKGRQVYVWDGDRVKLGDQWYQLVGRKLVLRDDSSRESNHHSHKDGI